MRNKKKTMPRTLEALLSLLMDCMVPLRNSTASLFTGEFKWDAPSWLWSIEMFSVLFSFLRQLTLLLLCLGTSPHMNTVACLCSTWTVRQYVITMMMRGMKKAMKDPMRTKFSSLRTQVPFTNTRESSCKPMTGMGIDIPRKTEPKGRLLPGHTGLQRGSRDHAAPARTQLTAYTACKRSYCFQVKGETFTNTSGSTAPGFDTLLLEQQQLCCAP